MSQFKTSSRNLNFSRFDRCNDSYSFILQVLSDIFVVVYQLDLVEMQDVFLEMC